MAIVTFLSDFGTVDHYVAAVKANIFKAEPSHTVVDITHDIEVGDIGQAAHVLREVYHEFPKGTVHLVAVSDSSTRKSRCIAVMMDDHFFVGEDNGIFSLVSDVMPQVIVHLTEGAASTFPAKDVMANAAGLLASGHDIQSLGAGVSDFKRFMVTEAKATKQQIAGNIIHVDHYGNLITNILKRDFEAILKINQNCPYEVNFRREKITQVNSDFSEVGAGECFVLFNSGQKLQIGIRQGRGCDLLGLDIGDQVFIDFKN